MQIDTLASAELTSAKYDVPTAVIFFSAGLALGAMLSFVLSPLKESSPVLHSTPDWMPAEAGRW
jgi:hypothetical protein